MISIIVPVHNVEKYILQLLYSILDAGFNSSKHELIIVDDGSTDATQSEIQKFQSEHNEIQLKLIKQRCKGVSNARNEGLKEASHEYVWFVDGDDLLPQGVLEFLENFIEIKRHPDVIRGGYTVVREDSKFLRLENQFVETKKENNVGGAIWTTLVKRDLLEKNDIKFCEEISYGEDYLWCFMVYSLAKEIVDISEIYGYRQSLDSAMRTSDNTRTLKRCQDMITLADQYRALGKKYEIDTSGRVALSIQSLLFDSIRCSLSKEKVKELLLDAKKRGLYPYPIIWKHLIPNTSFSHTVINYLTLLFPVEPVFWFCYYVVSKFMKFK